MNDPETLLRQHFSAAADSVPVDANLLEGVDRLRRDRRRRRFVGGGSALAVVVIAAVVAVPLAVVGHHGDTASLTSGGPEGPANSTTQQIIWGGIAFSVPRSWQVTRLGCGPPQRNSVVYALAAPSCPPGAVLPAPAVPSTVAAAPAPTVISLSVEGVAPSTGPTTETRVAGLPATFAFVPVTTAVGGATSSAGPLAEPEPVGTTVVYIPSRHVVFDIDGPSTASRALALLSSAVQVRADANGCPGTTGVSPEATGSGATRPGEQDLGSPPVRARLCAYAGRGLVSSATITDAPRLRTFVGAIERTPPALTAAERDNQRMFQVDCSIALSAVADIADADGTTHVVVVRTQPCGDTPTGLVVSSSASPVVVTSTYTDELIGDLAALLPLVFTDIVYGGAQPTGCMSCVLSP